MRPILNCPNCGAKNSPENQFCASCGTNLTSLKNTCPSCGASNEVGEEFCQVCGWPLKDNMSNSEFVDSYYPVEKPKRFSTTSIIIITILATLLVFVIGYFGFRLVNTNSKSIPVTRDGRNQAYTQDKTDKPYTRTDTSTDNETANSTKTTDQSGPFYSKISSSDYSTLSSSAVTGSFNASASSYRLPINGFEYVSAYAVDGNTQTAWIEGAYNSSGEYLDLTYTGNSPVTINQIGILSGYTKDYESFSTNSAPARLKLYLNNKYIADIVLQSDMTQDWQIVDIAPLTISKNDVLRFEIAEHLEGSQEELNQDDMDDVAITEIVFM